jgi:type III restriction enzyme
MELKEYQEDKIERLKEEINELLESQENRVIILKAPTGSGKTVMVAETLKRLVKKREDRKELAFIWIAPRMLHGQSKDKLDNYYENDRTLECVSVDDLQDGMIQENEILFLNWESLNKKNNILMIDNELDKNLTRIVEKTKDEGREIILVIDESHHTAKTETARRLINDISPKITLEVSATPHLVINDPNFTPRIVEVEFSKVIEEGMIKKEVLINPGLDKEKTKGGADSLVIKAALDKKAELLAGLKAEKSKVNPLILIQLPDKKAGVLDRKEEIVKKLETEFKVTEANGKLAIWLSEEKTPNLANIEKEDSEVEVLLFKQAIALGWDCPRAAILVLFRDWKSIEFSIQTIGRIMRMPDFYHYGNEALNKGYVFTNLSDISIQEGIAKDYITVFEAKRNDKIYKNVDLQSIHIMRQREKTRLSGQFSEIFLEVATKNKLHNEIDLKAKAVTEIMVDGKIQKIDQIIDHVYKAGVLKVKQEEVEIQYLFELFIRENCKPYAPADSSGRIRTAIYKFFEKKIKIKDETQIQKIILSDENMEKVKRNIAEAKDAYKKAVVDVEEEANVEKYRWNVPEIISYNSNYKETKMNKSIITPFYAKTQSKPEQEFIKLLEKSENVVWWFKNGETEIKYFAVLWEDEFGKKHGFYVDFIFQMKDGTIGIFDTKSGRTAQGDAKQKAEALAKYIKEENKRGKHLVGGLIIQKDDIWRYNDSENYSFDENNLDQDWKFLKL